MTVVAGVDDSPVSVLVTERAVEQARWRGTDVHLVHVVYLAVNYAETIAIDWTEIERAQRRTVWNGLEAVIASADVPIEKIDLEGYPPDSLVAYAADQNASLLVVGTRGRGEFASLVLGSTSHRAIHLSECDVLIVKTPQGTSGRDG